MKADGEKEKPAAALRCATAGFVCLLDRVVQRALR